MLRATFKKLISALLVMVICLSVIPVVSFDSFAANGIEMRLEKLKKEFPDGYYWNHEVKSSSDRLEGVLEKLDEKYAYSVSKTPCTDHNKATPVGGQDCNYFDSGYQCHGFAAMLFYKIFGQRSSTLPEVDKKLWEIKPGDLVRIKNDTHSAIVLSVSGLKYTVAECNIADENRTGGCEISWGRELYIADIDYYVRASNYDKISADTNWKNIEAKANQGNSFYGAIVNTKSGKALTSENGKVVMKAYKATATQVWRFTRQSDGSYKIISCQDSKALSLDASNKVVLMAKTDSKNQLWSFYGSTAKLYLSNESGNGVVTVKGDANIVSDTKTAADSKLFTLKTEQPPVASVIKAQGGVGNVSLSWSKGKYTTAFDVEIYSGTKLVKAYRNVTVVSGKVTLAAGNYSVKIISKNAYSQTVGNTAHFTVSKQGELGKTAKVTQSATRNSITLSWSAVPGATGYRVFVKNGNVWKTLATTTKTSHTVSSLTAGKTYTLAVRAYKLQNKKATWAKTYTTFTAATKALPPSKVTATPSLSDIKLSWTASKNATGYRIYEKTASGWKTLATVKTTKATLKSLPSGKTYNLAVRPYTTTNLGTVWGDYKAIKTATKPAAPKVSVSDIKGLGAKIKWTKAQGAEGYQVYFKLDNTSYKKLGNYKATDTGVQLSKLTYGVYYTFAVRGYKKVDGGYVYGPYNTVRFKAKVVG